MQSNTINKYLLYSKSISSIKEKFDGRTGWNKFDAKTYGQAENEKLADRYIERWTK
jgi:hypothetical protein